MKKPLQFSNLEVVKRVRDSITTKSVCPLLLQTGEKYALDCGRTKRVVGGKEVNCGMSPVFLYVLRNQPRIASLRNATSSQHLCVATLLSTEFAVTAAHCVSYGTEQYALFLNNFCTDKEVPTIEVVEIIVNDMYDKYSRAHDIAVIRISLDLNDTAWLNHTVLPKSSFGLSGECTMFGYGYQDPDVKETSDVLQSGPMSIVSLDYCSKSLGQYVAPDPNSGMMCAMGAGVDACQGDSGGPLICRGLVEAVSSYGMSCGVPGLPGVFTSIGAHLKWINNIINSYR